MPTVLMTGGTGMVGTRLTSLLTEKGYKVIILTRDLKSAISKQPHDDKISYARWNPEDQTIDGDAISKSDYVIHLAGANIGEKRWTKRRKREILRSRTQSGSLIVKGLKENPNNIKAVVSASAIGWYGPDSIISKDKGFTESHPSNSDFLGDTVRLWEESIQRVTAFDKRLVKFRFGVIFSNKGGAMKRFKEPIKFGIAPVMGSGKQILSWIHIDDACRLYINAIENESLSGVYNAVSPMPVSNEKLMITLAQKMKGKAFIKVYVPEWTLKLMFGELSIEVLKSTTVSSEKIRGTGFQFIYPSIESAFDNLLKTGN